MHCQQANEIFSDYIERALNPAMTVSVDNHLAACPTCREEMAALRLVWTQLDQVAHVEPPVRLHAGIMDALEAHLEAEHATSAPAVRNAGWSLDNLRALFRPRTLAYAATALVLALSSLEVVQSQRAALGPLGLIARVLHLQSQPSESLTLPAIAATHSEWTATASGGGTLVVAMQTDAAKAAMLEPLTYHAELAADNAPHDTNTTTYATGHFDAAGTTTLRLPLPHGIAGPNVHIALSFWNANDNKVAQQEIVVPIERKVGK